MSAALKTTRLVKECKDVGREHNFEDRSQSIEFGIMNFMVLHVDMFGSIAKWNMRTEIGIGFRGIIEWANFVHPHADDFAIFILMCGFIC